MIQIRRWALPVLLILPLLPACGGATDAPPSVASIDVAPADGAIVPGGTITLRADLRDATGRRLDDRVVTWTTSTSGIIISISGPRITGLEPGGPVTIRAAAEGRRDSAQVTVITSGSPLVDSLLRGMDEFVTVMLRHNQGLLPLNPTLEPLIRSKIALLERPELSSEIVRGRYAEGAVRGEAREVPLVAAFVADSMRPGVEIVIREVEAALPVLESFMDATLVAGHLRLWYGFALGSRGGGGQLNLEDQGTYDGRRASGGLPYLAIVGHELAHSFMGHESLTQFLELYLYNVTRTGSTDVAAWIHTRGYTPDRDDNVGIHALLDIYRIIGHDPMVDAFRALDDLDPQFGQPLSDAARAAIVERAPAGREAEVTAKVDRIGV